LLNIINTHDSLANSIKAASIRIQKTTTLARFEVVRFQNSIGISFQTRKFISHASQETKFLIMYRLKTKFVVVQ
jgi:hypothetical protein